MSTLQVVHYLRREHGAVSRRAGRDTPKCLVDAPNQRCRKLW